MTRKPHDPPQLIRADTIADSASSHSHPWVEIYDLDAGRPMESLEDEP